MATWINISSTAYSGASGSGVFKILAQYDKDSDTATTMKVRLCVELADGWSDSAYAANGYYLLYSPGATTEKLYTIKAPDTDWEDGRVIVSFTLGKTYSASNFVFPAFWICNTGSVKPDLTSRTIVYNSYSGSMYNLFKSGGQREGYVTYVSSKSLAGIKATAGTAPSVSVADLGNNKVIISGSLGTNGSSNTIKSAMLYYTTDGTDPSSSSSRILISLTATSGAAFAKTIPIASACTVKAYVSCSFTFNTTGKAASTTAKYYVAPGNPGKPVLSTGSFKNNKLTVKQNWTYAWTAASAGNVNSPVAGYRIRLYKNNINIPILNSAGAQLSVLNTGSTTDYVYDTENISTVLTINPSLHGYTKGDTVYLTIFAYAKNGASDKLWSGSGATAVSSASTTVTGAGTVRVKPAGSWVEGQVYVKVNKTWVEAEAVSVKASGSWKESQ